MKRFVRDNIEKYHDNCNSILVVAYDWIIIISANCAICIVHEIWHAPTNYRLYIRIMEDYARARFVSHNQTQPNLRFLCKMEFEKMASTEGYKVFRELHGRRMANLTAEVGAM